VSADQAGPRGGFGALLRRHRLAAGLSQEELADRSGLSARAIADMERGRTVRPYRRSVRALADAMALAEPERALLDRASRPTPVAASTALPPSTCPGSGQQGKTVPRQLPAAVSCFTGRGIELTMLSGMLGTGPRAPMPTLVISAIAGTAGVGKTALAVHWAHLVAERFPDGQLYVNLHGYDLNKPVAAADALAGLLRDLGVPGHQIPDEMGARARLFRSRLAGRRVLVLLDNASDAEQVRPLLPGDPGCAAVITSRDALAGLVAADGARRLDLDVLPMADAVALLRSLIGPRADDLRSTTALAGMCARLPLALRIAAEIGAGRPSVTLAELAAELTAAKLDCLDASDARADLRTVFSWSVRQLPAATAQAFALIGLHPGVDLDVHAAAALTGTSTSQASRALRDLHRASLVQAVGGCRYGMHDLLRAYAREQAAAHDTGGQCRQALTRLFDYYLAAASAAMDALMPAEAPWRPRIRPATAIVPEISDEADARAWLDSERANLVAIVVYCASHGWPQQTADLAATLFRYLMTGSHLPEAHTIYCHALPAARRSADLAAEASALNGLGSIAAGKGRFHEAADYFHAALEHYRRSGDRSGEARAFRNLGAAEQELHNYRSAIGHYRQAITIFGDAGDSLSVTRILADLAGAEIELESYDDAAEHLEQCLRTLRKAGDERWEARALSRMGCLNLRRGQLNQAASRSEQALLIFRRLEDPAGVAAELGNLGEARLRQGEYPQAISYLRQALTLFRKVGYQHGETFTLRSLAEALHSAGQPAAARAELNAALKLAAATGNTHEQATVHRDLAENYYRGGEPEHARRHWQQALTLYTQLGAPEADQVRSRLSAQETKQAEPRTGQGLQPPDADLCLSEWAFRRGWGRAQNEQICARLARPVQPRRRGRQGQHLARRPPRYRLLRESRHRHHPASAGLPA